MKDAYYASRYTPDPARTVVWKEIVRFLAPYISPEATVVDLGAGYCDFVNTVRAKVKYAVDTSPELSEHAGAGVMLISQPAWELNSIPDHSVDVVHASNLFEHFTDDELERVMAEVRRVLKPGGRLILMQPNYRLTYKNYFDDPTHKKIFTDASLQAFLESHGFAIRLAKPKFLPFSMKSRGALPVSPLIVRAYIHSPIKPFAGQMLVIGELTRA
ncbi:MAG TPA: methyltransferase domain-containing protein [Candidatus Paceibacterota bacterium]|nr:methyltransferase domain-containing protein [Candidatus Paceibacterota bacterium]